MKKISTLINRLFALLLCVAAAVSCDSLIYEYEGDCSVHNKVLFTYEYNIKFADAFKNEVKSVDLYVFDHATGGFVTKFTCSAESYAQNNGLELVDLKAGTYDMIAWAWGDATSRSYDIPQMNSGDPKSKLTAHLKRISDAEGSKSKERLTGLFYSQKTSVKVEDTPGEHIVAVMDLMKDTNRIVVVLQHLSGEDVDVENFEFVITDDNGYLSSDNAVIPEGGLTYYPYGRRNEETTYEREGKQSVMKTALVEFSISRFMYDEKARLTVKNVEGKTVLSIPLASYAAMVRDHYKISGAQEYLDRQDDFSFIFFLDDDNEWFNAKIIINSWVLVLNDVIL